MSELAIYCALMFWAGVLITKVVFFYEERRRTRNFYLTVSLTVLQILDSVYSAHQASVESAAIELKKIENIEAESNKLCSFREFELNPHQKIIRNFMSNETPYNGLLLFHGLGTGKTCSSIQVCEEVRKQLKMHSFTDNTI